MVRSSRCNADGQGWIVKRPEGERGGDVPVESCFVTVNHRFVMSLNTFILFYFLLPFLTRQKQQVGDGTCVWVVPENPAARLVCGERPGGESCHTVLAPSALRTPAVRGTAWSRRYSTGC